jgi:bacterioferritin
MAETLPLNIGDNVKAQLENDLKLELSAVTMYNNGIKKSREVGDNASADLLEKLLKDEEGHVDWLESQLHMIKELGYENYLAQQLEEEE